MSKTENCLKMLQILNTGRIYKVDELAALLSTNARNIPEYKKELEMCGYEILSTSGRYGGYYLNKSNLIPSFKLLEEEKYVLIESFNYCLSKPYFINKKELITSYSKLCSNLSFSKYKDKTIILDQYQLTMSDEDIFKRFNFISQAIDNTTTVELLYESLKTGINKHTVNPYKLFIFNNTWYFLALDFDSKEIRVFKINRIKEFKETNKKFTIPKNFNPDDYFVYNGFKTEGEFIHVKLLAKGSKKRLIAERVYGRNQKITELDESSAIVELDMQDEDKIITRILSFGSEVELLEPLFLVEKLKEKLKKIESIYSK